MITHNTEANITKLTSLIRQVTIDLPPSFSISESTRFIEDIGMESINRLMLISLVEQKFGVNLEQHMPELVELHTVGDTARFISSLQGAA